MKYAVIDIGTNSVRLMLAEREGGGVRTLYKKQRITKLGEGMNTSGDVSLLPTAMNRTCEAVCAFVKEAEWEGAGRLFAYATSAVREAANGGEFRDMVKRACAINIDVISGMDEAKIGITGADADAVIDIGGGSTEIISRRPDGEADAVSVKIGSVRLMALYPCEGKVDDTEGAIEASRRFFAGLPNLGGRKWTGIGGTATSLAAVDLALEKYDPERVQGHFLTREGLYELFLKMCAMTAGERRQMKGMHPDKTDTIVSGAAVLLGFMEAAGAESIIVSENDGMEGYLLMRTGKQEGKR